MKITAAPGPGDGRGELAEGLGHEPRLQARERVAHVAVQLRARHQRGHRVDHDHVHGIGPYQGLGDLERLLAGVGLGDQQLVGVDAEVLGVLGIERVLGVDEGGGAAHVLSLRDDVERQRGLAGRLRSVDLGHPAAGNAADAQRDVELERAGGDDGDLIEDAALTQAHDGALAELAVDRGDGQLQGLAAVALDVSHADSPRLRVEGTRDRVREVDEKGWIAQQVSP